MKIEIKHVLGAGFSLLFSSLAWAQTTSPEEAEAAAATACATCGGCGVAILVFLVVMIALNIALLVWVARDARARGLDSSVLWMFLVMFTGLIGFLIYIFSRPQGALTICPNCKGKRLQTSAKCPHCGAP